jgi:RNA polymerase sigma factor (sigma-70 family)
MKSSTVDELFRRLNPALVRMVERRVGRSPVVEDACSFAWQQLVAGRADHVPHGKLGAWLYVVATREAWRLMGRETAMPPVGTADVADDGQTAVERVPDAADVEAQALAAVESDHVREALGRLKASQRLVLLLRARGYSYDQIGEATGRTYTWVNRHLAEGKRRLRQLLEEGGRS